MSTFTERHWFTDSVQVIIDPVTQTDRQRDCQSSVDNVHCVCCSWLLITSWLTSRPCSHYNNMILTIMHVLLTLMHNFHHMLVTLAVMVTFHRWQLVTFHRSRLIRLLMSLMVNFHLVYIYLALRIMDMFHHMSRRLVPLTVKVVFHHQQWASQHVIHYVAVINVNKSWVQTQLMSTAEMNVASLVSDVSMMFNCLTRGRLAAVYKWKNLLTIPNTNRDPDPIANLACFHV